MAFVSYRTGQAEPAWCRDGAWIAFASDSAGGTDLYLAEVATGRVTRLTQRGDVGQPAWLADGRLVFTSG